MQEKMRIDDLSESNIEDLLYVCSSTRPKDPIHQQGMKLRRQWLHEMIRKHGPIAKIGYYNDKPVAQILYYPEDADVTKASPRKNALIILCVYNPTSNAQKLGIGTMLLQSLIKDAKQRKTCLGNKPCKFLLTAAFDAGELLPMPEFFKKNGFIPTSEGDMLYLPIESSYEPRAPIRKYEPLPEDQNKAVIFHSPICQFSFPFARRIAELVKGVAPDLQTEMINQWERPEESIKRENGALIVNATPIRTFFMDTERFKEEVRLAVSKKPQ